MFENLRRAIGKGQKLPAPASADLHQRIEDFREKHLADLCKVSAGVERARKNYDEIDADPVADFREKLEHLQKETFQRVLTELRSTNEQYAAQVDQMAAEYENHHFSPSSRAANFEQIAASALREMKKAFKIEHHGEKRQTQAEGIMQLEKARASRVDDIIVKAEREPELRRALHALKSDIYQELSSQLCKIITPNDPVSLDRRGVNEIPGTDRAFLLCISQPGGSKHASLVGWFHDVEKKRRATLPGLSDLSAPGEQE